MVAADLDNPVVNHDAADDKSSVAGSSLSHEESSKTSGVAFVTEERDEVKEMRKMSRHETQLINVWRVVVTVALLAVAAGVIVASYRFLMNAQTNSYQTAFAQFSGTLADSTTAHQRMVASSIRDFAESIEANAMAANATWPFYTLPFFENYAEHALVNSNTEIITIGHFVQNHQMEAWINYTNTHHEAWVKEGHVLQKGNLKRLINTSNYHPYMTERLSDGEIIPENVTRDFYVADWSYSPPPSSYGAINWDFRTVEDYENIIQAAGALKNETVFTRVRPYAFSIGLAFTVAEHNAMHSALLHSNSSYPHCFAFHPVHKVLRDPESEIVAVLHNGIALDASLRGLLPDDVDIIAVVKNNCNETYTFEIIGPEALFLGDGDLHDTKFDDMEVTVNMFEGLYSNPNYTSTPGHCLYTMHIYPSQEFFDSYDKTTPKIFAIVLALTFMVIFTVFVVYDIIVQKRNEKIIAAAARSNAVVASLFPDNIRDRLIGGDTDLSKTKGNAFSAEQTKVGLKGIIGNESNLATYANSKSKPLADLFPEATVMFADLVGFTAWSSMREPSQVFILLETIYGAFDAIATRRRVFKVETVGDCYVAVCGLPDRRKDHHVVMARFARECVSILDKLLKQLEVELGPDTAELGMRVGLHSGPVTAGVLRGDRARFQLFGDTVNTTSRIESTGAKNRIHLSQETAELLITAGKESWVRKREDMVVAKGKGEIQTYWLEYKAYGKEKGDTSSCSSSQCGDLTQDAAIDQTAPDFFPGTMEALTTKDLRIVDWNTDILLRMLHEIVARREARGIVADPLEKMQQVELEMLECRFTPLETVRDIIMLPQFDPEAANQKSPHTIGINEEVVLQLRTYIRAIAALYHRNPFHSFEHASHVTMSVVKLLSRIVAPNEFEESAGGGDDHKTLHDHTYGITSDPLTQFSVVLAALIHDVDHQGVPNVQLVKEGSSIAAAYKNKSIAEQNSVDVAWRLLMQDTFSDLRQALYTTREELWRFRQLVVNAVMATDIMDQELSIQRKARWNKAFSEEASSVKVRSASSVRVDTNRKATIVIEHLIQASDVAHTMQHWHVYRKWNANLFAEMYRAYLDGRSDKDPSENWYHGELGFFDYYIIPLAMKLRGCGVFGVSSDEYYTYAQNNRREWEARGQELVAEMVESFTVKGTVKAVAPMANRPEHQTQIVSHAA